eukprot:TRINITY_DN7167_c0_g2_i1.p1 TRINITY_DN7167_c0_g2~~TRINITY_DN7167_c0_g2_i1.p1  ORF type:complete len:1070 (+),score=312.54 TRINITY_DN7167_c0_g2_i1:279-3212(+)
MADSKQRLEEVEKARVDVSKKSREMHNQIREAQEKLKGAEKDHKALAKQLQSLQKDKASIEHQKTEAIRLSTRAKLDIRDLEERLGTEGKSKSEIEEELRSLETQIRKAKEDLASVQPRHEEQVLREEEISRSIVDCERQLNLLHQKKNRASHFSNQADRDKHLQLEIQTLQKELKKKELKVNEVEMEINNLRNSENAEASLMQTREADLEQYLSAMKEFDVELANLKKERDDLQAQRKELWSQESQLKAELETQRIEVSKAEKHLDSITPADIRKGLTSVRRIVKDHNLSGVHGPMMELFDCEEKLFLPVEVTAGNSLFNVVVENDDTSSRIIKYLTQQKGGRCTFIPLNRIRVPEVQYPNSSDVVPLIKKLRYQDRYIMAFRQVFGKTVVCRDLDVATQVSRQSDLDSVTLEGDQVNKKGALTGGYSDTRKSRLKLVKIVKEGLTRLEEIRQSLDPIQGKLNEAEQAINKVLAEMQKLEAKKQTARIGADQAKAELRAMKSRESTNRKALEQKERTLAGIREGIAQLQASIDAKREEMKTALTNTLTEEEQRLLNSLNPEITHLKTSFKECEKLRMEIESTRTALEAQLSSNLLKRQEELEAQLANISTESRAAELDAKKEEVQRAQVAVEEKTQELKRTIGDIERVSKDIRQLKGEKDELKVLEDQYERTRQDEAKDLEQLVNKQNLLIQKQEDCMKKIRVLGSLPSDAFLKYQDKNLKELHKLLHKCNNQLKKYSHVNKKALDQYMNFTEQREELQKRQAEANEGDEKIRELIEVLDMRKDESIERTFKQVAKLFKTSFHELVPHGHGSLLMQKQHRAGEADEHDRDDDDDDEEAPNHDPSKGMEKYTGVKVKVSFGQGETQSIKQLSGGQKTVVALALIFAIQRCDPAPFYLFDEIDAALDPQYRTAVGNMIRRQADEQGTQFITTTFRPELVKVADRIYGVFHKNRVSTVDVIDVDQALQFIEQDQNHQNS